jgi:glycosyltransferase involved in cell wall biosynthesis
LALREKPMQMRTPQIAIFLPSLCGGGAERVMVTLANALSERGYVVDLVLAAAEGPYLADVAPTVRIIDLKAGRVLKALLPLAAYLRKQRPESLLAAMTHANVIALAARMLARAPVRLLVTEHSTISVDCRRARGWVAGCLYAVSPKLYPRADGIVAVSQAAASDLVQFAALPATAVKAIYNPFDLPRIRSLAAEPTGHPWLAPGQPPVVLAAGRLIEQKDFHSLLSAFAQLRVTRKARLLILGEGELRSELEMQVTSLGLTAEEVQMPGFVANPFAYMAACAVFVLSSRLEGLSSVLIEAMAAGAPVVSTDCPSGPSEILEGGRWGTLVPVGDAEALAGAIDHALSMPRSELPQVQARAAYFDQAKAVDAYLAALGLPPQRSERLNGLPCNELSA